MRTDILTIILALTSTIGVRAQMFAFNTDLAWDVACVPSLGIEIGTGNSTSFAFNAFGGYKPWGCDSKFVGVQPEFRYWLSGRSMHQQYIGIGGIIASYDFPVARKIYDGYTAGLGVTFGYAYKLNKHFVLTLHGGCGLLFYNQKEYFKGDDYDSYTINGEVQSNATGYNILPTNVGVTISYILH
jgi:hypothetical protein